VRGRRRGRPVRPCAAAAVPKALVLAPWRMVLCYGVCLTGLSIPVVTCTVYLVSIFGPISGGLGARMRDAQRADVDVVVLKQTARVAQMGCRQILCKRTLVICFVSSGALRSSLRVEGRLLRQRESVDRSEGGAVFARSSAHGLRRL
jgi:hypothetical protein